MGLSGRCGQGRSWYKVIFARFEVQSKDSRVYELLDELGLSYQRAHRDYANADPQAQTEWVEAVKKTLSFTSW